MRIVLTFCQSSFPCKLPRREELIPAWSTGESRAPGKPQLGKTAPPKDTPGEPLTSGRRAPIRLWAAFNLSGLGR